LSRAVVNILGVGNPLMGDDGVGVAAVEMMQRRGASENVCLYDAGLAVSDVLGTLDPSDPLVIIDALRAGGRPGDLYKVRLDEISLREDRLSACISLHQLSVLPSLQIEAMTGRRFADVIVFGVEPGVVEWGRGLSKPVTHNMERLIETVLAYAAEAGGETSSGQTRCRCATAGDTSP